MNIHIQKMIVAGTRNSGSPDSDGFLIVLYVFHMIIVIIIIIIIITVTLSDFGGGAELFICPAPFKYHVFPECPTTPKFCKCRVFSNINVFPEFPTTSDFFKCLFFPKYDDFLEFPTTPPIFSNVPFFQIS